jgi:hypothetical protein
MSEKAIANIELMAKVTGAEQRLALLRFAVSTWSEDRSPHDFGERQLLATFLTLFPEEAHTKETCGACNAEERAVCDECLSQGEVEYFIKAALKDSNMDSEKAMGRKLTKARVL